jgi:hypothetical protein
MMTFPTATRKTAFIAGISFAMLMHLLSTLEHFDIIPAGSSEKDPFSLVLVAVFFLVSVLLFVIDVKSIAPKELKTRIPLLYIPTNRVGWNYMFRVWGRMAVWFLGVAITMSFLSVCQTLFK